MGMVKRKMRRQGQLWVVTAQLAQGPGHPFYQRLNKIIDKEGFDDLAEGVCRRFYSERIGRPSLAPAVYCRLPLIGYFEGIDSERGIAWRVADSITLRDFLSLSLTESTPDHSTMSRNRRLIDVEAHEEVLKLPSFRGQLRLWILSPQSPVRVKTRPVRPAPVIHPARERSARPCGPRCGSVD